MPVNIEKMFLMGQTRPLFDYFRSFRMTNIAQVDYDHKSIDAVLGARTWGNRMVGADESTELWQHRCLTIIDNVRDYLTLA